ncbi:hypothetical protein [Flavobacterium reichenbachii]|uniref:hypothetical protein n=1 Tax=Flavobacterium reichenbachii TaxID=362418 RepID=UPI000B5BA014|nr:hypothetical protein [Flavobacterium reichenbachii]OXB15785.1 hypothetical protein B0A68_08965 [Flavobacterium reichenbachii]
MKLNKLTIFILLELLITVIVKAQSLNQTHSIQAIGSANTFNQGYTFSYASAGTPWNGALISFGGMDNRYDCQISADYAPDGGNRISFRTKNGDFNNGTGAWNPWNELATKGSNSYVGNQFINGNVGIGTSSPNSRLDLGSGYGVKEAKFLIYNDDSTSELSGTKCGFYMDNFTSNNLNLVFPEASSYPGLFTVSAKNTADDILKPYFSIVGLTGNVGIGKTKPDSKLTVAGNISSREVKVTVDAGADFVFEDDYNLPSLEFVDKFIKEKKHLPEIASAKQMQEDGINLSEMNIRLLQKIEELTLYSIQQNKKIEEQSKEIESLKSLVLRVGKIEKELSKK